MKKRVIIGICVTVIILLGVSVYTSKYAVTTSKYVFQNKEIFTSLRILQLSDLHNSEFGSHNTRLVAAVQSETPDLIFLTGDLLNSDEERTDIATNLIMQLCKIAPVYCSNGNHEIEYQQKYGTDVDELYCQAGAVVLEKEYQDVEVKDQKIRVGGIYGYCLPGKYLETGEADPEECAFLTDFQNTELPTFLMCHMPVCWMINGSLDEWNIDYIFAGHLHGGEVIFPAIGGLYGPDLGWFPGRMEGIYSSEDGTRNLILSRGLGTNERIPRFNNIPEIVVADIQGKG